MLVEACRTGLRSEVDVRDLGAFGAGGEGRAGRKGKGGDGGECDFAEHDVSFLSHSAAMVLVPPVAGE